jgi:hypothetical protein
MIQALGWVATLGVLGSYFWSVHFHNGRPFDWGNVLASMVLLPINVYYGVYFGAFLNLSFGLIGMYGLWKYRNGKVPDGEVETA